MSTQVPSELNALKAGSHQYSTPKCQIDIQEWASSNFNVNDHFITLTYRQYVNRNEVERSSDIKHFLNKLNRKVFGMAYVKGHIRLKTFPVFEINKSGGLHVHMVVGRPESILLSKPLEELAKEAWLSMKCGGSPKAQDVRNCYEVMGLIGYNCKQIKLNDKLLMLDVLNIHWPL